MNIYSPLEQFEVVSLIHLQSPLLNYTTISLTNLGLYSVLAVLLIVSFHVVSSNDNKLVPSRWGIMLETLYATINNLVRSQIGSRHEQYFPMLYAVFMYILLCNLLGNVTYGFTVTSSMALTLGFSFSVLISVTVLSVSKHGLKFLTFFIPSGTPAGLVPVLAPIEVISYLARGVSLGVRLSANMISGHALMVILAGFLVPAFTGGFLMSIVTLIPFVLFIAIVALEVTVAVIQSYVFTILIASYLKDAIYLH